MFDFGVPQRPRIGEVQTRKDKPSTDTEPLLVDLWFDAGIIAVPASDCQFGRLPLMFRPTWTPIRERYADPRNRHAGPKGTADGLFCWSKPYNRRLIRDRAERSC